MKKLLTISCLLLLFSVTAKADSISPDSFSATLAPGESVTIEKTVTVDEGAPTSSKVDVFFLADETGSMTDDIAAVKSAASSILSSAAVLGDVAFGVGGYKDVGDSFIYNLRQDITTSSTAAQTEINNWTALGGGDTPEAQLYALEQVATTTSWRTGSERILVWFGDAPGHDPRNGSTEASATAALQAANIAVQAIDTYEYDSASYDGLEDYGQASRIAAATGGTFYDGIDETSIVSTINDAITTAVETYTTVGIDTSDVPSEIGVTVLPPSFVGTYDRSITRSFLFDVTFTAGAGAVPGATYDFSLYGTVDGGRVAEEIDSISIVPVPGAFLLGMLGLSVAGVKLRKRA